VMIYRNSGHSDGDSPIPATIYRNQAQGTFDKPDADSSKSISLINVHMKSLDKNPDSPEPLLSPISGQTPSTGSYD